MFTSASSTATRRSTRPTCRTSEANAPSWVDSFRAGEDFGQSHFQMLARSGVYHHETKLLFQTLGHEHFSRSEREEVAGKIRAQFLPRGFDLEHFYLLQMLFNLCQLVQVHRC